MDVAAQESARMLSRMLLRPVRGYLLWMRLLRGRLSGAAAAYEANGRPGKDVAFRGHM